MDFLIQSGRQWIAHWQGAAPASRWTLVLGLAGVLALVGGVAFWPRTDAREILFDGVEFSRAELTAMEAAFGKAQLNDARVVGRSIEVPQRSRHLYLKALHDQQALPPAFFSYAQRTLASDHPFASPRQRDALAKLAKEQEVALVLRKIAGIDEASVQFEDVDSGGFPRRKQRRATAAVRACADQPLETRLVRAIAATLANTLGIADTEAVTILDLNAGIAYSGEGVAAGTSSTVPQRVALRVAPTSSQAARGPRSPASPVETSAQERDAAMGDIASAPDEPSERVAVGVAQREPRPSEPRPSEPRRSDPRRSEQQRVEHSEAEPSVEPRSVDDDPANKRAWARAARSRNAESRLSGDERGTDDVDIEPQAAGPMQLASRQQRSREGVNQLQGTESPLDPSCETVESAESDGGPHAVAGNLGENHFAGRLFAGRLFDGRALKTWVRDNGLTLLIAGIGLTLWMGLARQLRSSRAEARQARHVLRHESARRRSAGRASDDTLDATGRGHAHGLATHDLKSRDSDASASDARDPNGRELGESRRKLREQIHEDVHSAADTLRQWLGNAA